MNTLCTNATVCDMILKRVTCVESLCPFPVIKSSDQSMRLPGKLTCRHSIHHQRVYNVPTKSWWPCNTRPLVNCYSFFDSDLNQEDGTNLCIPCMQRILWYRPYINIFSVWLVVLRRFDACGHYLDYINLSYSEDLCIKT